MRLSFRILFVATLVIAMAGIGIGDNNYNYNHNHNHNHNNDDSNDGGGLRFGFYSWSCPQAETVVKNITWNRVGENPALAAKLLRLHFHDCFVEGCDGSVLLDSTPGNTAEKDAIPNLTLGGFDVIDEIKAQLEQVCPGVVSCADVVALSARDAVSYQYQHDLWPVFTGRRDGSISKSSEALANLPSPFADIGTLKQNFAIKGLSVFDLVVLSGAHTIGIGHCAVVVARLYNFTGKGDTDPSLDPSYASFLKTKCPPNFNPSTTLEMDPNSALSFDTHYYQTVKDHMGLFESDAELLSDPVTSSFVNILQNPHSFFPDFARSMVKMGDIGVRTGQTGQIRKNCHVIN